MTIRVRALRSAAAALVAAAAACGEPAQEGPGPKAPAAGERREAKAEAPTSAEAPDRAEILAAYDRGLEWLASRQNHGVWSVQEYADPGFTALAAAAMIERPSGPRDKDRPVIDAALAFLARSFAEDGGIDTPQYRNYVTSVAVMALAAGKRPEHKPLIERASAYLKSLQFVEERDESYGGIGYGSERTRSDLSNTQYALASLRAAGVPESDPVFQRALVFLQRTQNRKENEAPGEPTMWKDAKTGKTLVRSNDGGANYRPGDSKALFDERPDGTGVLRSYGSMTYALLRCYHLAGVDLKDGRVRAAVDWISGHWDLDRNPGMPEDMKFDGLFYYYATIAKTLPPLGIDRIEAPGGRSIDWRAELAAKILSLQKPDGSWASPDPRWMESLPVLATSYALAALQACVR